MKHAPLIFLFGLGACGGNEAMPADAAPLPVDAGRLHANDVREGATAVLGTGTFPISFDEYENDEDVAGAGCGIPGGRDAFFQIEVAAEGHWTFGTSAFGLADTVLRLADGPCATGSATPRCDDDACVGEVRSLLMENLAPGTYCLTVDEHGSSLGGVTTLTVTASTVVAHAVFAFASGTTCGLPDQVSSCAANDGGDVTYVTRRCAFENVNVTLERTGGTGAPALEIDAKSYSCSIDGGGTVSHSAVLEEAGGIFITVDAIDGCIDYELSIESI